jgi:serine/threonine protein kinase
MYTSSAGTLAFAAPERLCEGGRGYTEKVDIWAAGILLVMLLTGSHPFDHNGSTVHLI